MTKAGEKIIEELNEALAIARGEQPARAVWHNGFRYVPETPWHPDRHRAEDRWRSSDLG